MNRWPRNPIIYEVNTSVWLNELTRKYETTIKLDCIPSLEWDSIVKSGADAVWLMGVWERSPVGITISKDNPDLSKDFFRALPDFSDIDNMGSPYCIRRYEVDAHLGGANGLAIAREELHQRGVLLILDYVPNHVAPDHPWVSERPDYFISGSDEDHQQDPLSFMKIGSCVLARGRDPYFPAWPDVLQLNAFNEALLSEIVRTLELISSQCDGVRCDMAMLMLGDVFEKTWGKRAGTRPEQEFWTRLISAIRFQHPDFVFIAEAYWGLEWELQQQGFDYCYDKTLYDLLTHANASSIRQHLLADMFYQTRLIRFIENHDEPRAAANFSSDHALAAAVALLTLPGAKLLHEGQFEGRKVRLPVFLGRRPDEPKDEKLAVFYQRLIKVLSREVFRNGTWNLCEAHGWPDNASCQNLLTWCWEWEDERHLVVINFSDFESQALVRMPWDNMHNRLWSLVDHLSNEAFVRCGTELTTQGLYVSLKPWSWHLFAVN